MLTGLMLFIFLPRDGAPLRPVTAPADPARLQAHVESLCTLSHPRSVYHPESLGKSADFIESQFLAYTSRVKRQPYRADRLDVCNLIASFGPEDGSRTVVGAHYDVCGNQPGADDNASGVAGVLELARLLAAEGATLKKRVDLVAYTLEEPPYFCSALMGSHVHARSLKDNRVEVDLMVSLEMIGYFSDEKGSQRFPVGVLRWFYPTTGNYIAVVTDLGSRSAAVDFANAMAAGSTVPVERLAAPRWIPGVDFSDHLNYWECGYPALMITDTAFYRNPHYHEAADIPQTLDYKRMAVVVTDVLRAILQIAG